MNVVGVLNAEQAAQMGTILSGTRGAQEAGVVLGAAMASMPALGSAGAGAAHVEAHVSPVRALKRVAPADGAAHFAYIYVPQGSLAQSFRLRDPRTGATGLVLVQPNGLLVYRSELIAEAVGAEQAAVVHGRLGARGA